MVLNNKTPYTRTARLWVNNAQNNTYDSVGTLADAPQVKKGSSRPYCDSNTLAGVQFKKDIRVVVPPFSSKTAKVVSLDGALTDARDVLSITGLGEDLTPYIVSKPHPTPNWYNIQSYYSGDANFSSIYYANGGGTYGFLNNGQMNLNLTKVTDGSSTWDAGTDSFATLTPSADFRQDKYKLWVNGGTWTFTWYQTGPGSRALPASN